MTDKFYRTPSAVIVLVVRKGEDKTFVLCQRRSNTAYADGLYEFSCSGKVEEGESIRAAAIREAKEELGIGIAENELKLFALEHKCEEDGKLSFYKAFFITDKFTGTPHICEEEKCSDLRWFALDCLPDDMIEECKTAASLYLSGGNYFEIGWNK